MIPNSNRTQYPSALVNSDGWTAVSADPCRSQEAQHEYTLQLANTIAGPVAGCYCTTVVVLAAFILIWMQLHKRTKKAVNHEHK